MYMRISSLGLLFAFLLSTAGGIAQPSSPPEDFNLEDYEYIPGELLVKFKPTVEKERASQVMAEVGAEKIREVQAIDVDVLRLPKGLTVEKALEVFSKRPEVAYAEPNYLIELASNLEAEVVDQWALQKIEAPAAWAYLSGNDPSLLAVVDTGIDPSNPDLENNMWSNPDEVLDGKDTDGNGYTDDIWGWDFVNNDNEPMDDHMHGTAVSSVAAGNQDDNGVAGVCPWCTVMAVKVIGSDGSGALDVAASGITYAANNGARVINLSLAAPMGLQVLQDAVDYAWNNGALVVAAAGNDGAETVVYPAGYQNAMTVASTDSEDHHSCFSNYSDGYVSVAAPGTYVLFSEIGGSLGAGSGTSLSTPHVVGLAGLLLSQDPNRTNQDLWNLIEASANDLGPVGSDAYFGAGRINAYRAVTGNTIPTDPPDEDYVLVDDPTAYAHARKMARSSDGILHLVWYDKVDGNYKIQYAASSNDGASWSPAETIFTSSAETYHPAITLDKNNLYVVFPTLDGASAYRVFFATKPVSGGAWSPPTPILGGGYHAVRPDIYLDPTNNRLHVVASSFDNAKYAYYRSSDDGGANWTTTKNVDFAYNTRYASVYAYGEKVYIASRVFTNSLYSTTYYVFMMRSLNGGVSWQDRIGFDSHQALLSGEYGLSLAGFEDTLFMINEHNQEIRFSKMLDYFTWDRVIVYSKGGGKWPTLTATPDGKAWLGWLNNYDQLMIRKYIGGPLGEGSSYDPPETLYGAKYPNFKETTSYGRAEWISTDCSGAPFGLSYDFRAEGSNMPPLAFFDAPESAESGVTVQFDATESYDPDGDLLTFSWDFGDGNSGSGETPSHTYDTGGTFTVTLTLTDAFGGTDTAEATLTVEQSANQPPTAAAGGPYSGTEDVAVEFDGSASSDPDRDPLFFTWDFGDGTTGTGATPSHTYLYGGEFTVRLTVDDGISSDYEVTTVTVTEVNDLPTAVTNGPFAVNEDDTVFFDGSGSSDPDNLDGTTANDQTLTYHWDFGDDNTSIEVIPSHSYSYGGEFTVRLTVNDGITSDYAETTVSVAEVNDQPTAVTNGPYSAEVGEAIFFHASGSSDPDNLDGTVANDQNLTYQWDFGDGTTSTEISPSHSYTADGEYTVTLTVDDNSGELNATATATTTAIISPASSSSTLHIGDLDGDRVTIKNRWVAIVNIFVHDEQEGPVENATVTGTWSNGFDGTTSCTTDSNGYCAVESGEILKRIASVVFTVDDVTHNTLAYAPADNHEEEGDSDGTTITVYLDDSTSDPTPPPSGATMHVGDLDGSSVTVRTKWEAKVDVLVLDQNDNPLSGVMVTGSWDVGGEATCTTDAAGLCSVVKKNLKTSVASVTYSVADIALSGYSYDAAANTDPDEDSDGTNITVTYMQ